MTTHEQNKKAIREGQQGGPAQKNQAAQGALGAERDLHAPSGVQQGDHGLPPPQQQGVLHPKRRHDLQQGEPSDRAANDNPPAEDQSQQ